MNYRVVLADDEPEVLRSIQRTLDWEKYGFSVVGAFLNGLDVLEFLENHDVDIVFTDIRMPFMDGIELMHKIKEKYPYIKLVIIFHRVDFSHFILLLSKYWILSIINQALSKTKELPEIESRYFASEEEFPSLLASRQFIKAVILTDVCRYRFYAIPKLCIIAEFFTLHIPLALCPV